MSNPFLSANHCTLFATRVSILTNRPYHVITTSDSFLPRRVVSDEILHHIGMRCADRQVEYSAHPIDSALSQIA